MSSIAFIGLGIMGLPMANNLRRAGHSVTGVVRAGKPRPDGLEEGVDVVDDASAAVAGADVVITMLPDSPDVQRVVEQVAPALAEDVILIDMSTIDPGVTRAIGAALPPSIRFLDAPVSGGEAGAIEGVLSVMVGGEAAHFQAAKPIFDAVGKTVVHVGPLGAGQVVKAANQLVVAGNIQLLAEAIVFLESQGADLEASLDVLGGGLAGSTALERKRGALLSGDFVPGFRVALHNKDMGIVQSTATEAGLSLPVTAVVTQLLRAVAARGGAQLDHSALLGLAKELNRR